MSIGRRGKLKGNIFQSLEPIYTSEEQLARSTTGGKSVGSVEGTGNTSTEGATGSKSFGSTGGAGAGGATGSESFGSTEGSFSDAVRPNAQELASTAMQNMLDATEQEESKFGKIQATHLKEVDCGDWDSKEAAGIREGRTYHESIAYHYGIGQLKPTGNGLVDA